MTRTRSKRLPTVLTAEEAQNLLQTVSTRSTTGLRNRTMLQVLAGAEHGLGDDAAAMQHVTAALAILRAIERGRETGALARLGRIARDLGDDHAAAAWSSGVGNRLAVRANHQHNVGNG